MKDFKSVRSETPINGKTRNVPRMLTEMPAEKMIEYIPEPEDLLGDYQQPEVDGLFYEETVKMTDLECPFGNLAGFL